MEFYACPLGIHLLCWSVEVRFEGYSTVTNIWFLRMFYVYKNDMNLRDTVRPNRDSMWVGISSNTKVKQIFIPSVRTFHPVLQTVTRSRYMRYQFVEVCPTFRQSMEGYNTNQKMSSFSESCVLRMIKHLRNSKQPWVRDTSKSFSCFLEQATCSLIA